MWIFVHCFSSQFGFDCLPDMSCDVTCSPHKANSSYVFSNTLKWTGMRHLHTPYLHIHYYTLHLSVSSTLCALPPVAAYTLEPGRLPSVSLNVELDLWPLTPLAKGTNKLGHSPHTLSHLRNEGGDSKKVRSRIVMLRCPPTAPACAPVDMR